MQSQVGFPRHLGPNKLTKKKFLLPTHRTLSPVAKRAETTKRPSRPQEPEFLKTKKICLVNVKSFVSKRALGIAFRGHLPYLMLVRTVSHVQNNNTDLMAAGARIFENEKNFV